MEHEYPMIVFGASLHPTWKLGIMQSTWKSGSFRLLTCKEEQRALLHSLDTPTVENDVDMGVTSSQESSDTECESESHPLLAQQQWQSVQSLSDLKVENDIGMRNVAQASSGANLHGEQ